MQETFYPVLNWTREENRHDRGYKDNQIFLSGGTALPTLHLKSITQKPDLVLQPKKPLVVYPASNMVPSVEWQDKSSIKNAMAVFGTMVEDGIRWIPGMANYEPNQVKYFQDNQN